MITSIELISIVRKIVRDSGVRNIINGDVYLSTRPTNSTLNDIVIGSLAVQNDVLNQSVVLVNIYAKDIHDDGTFTPDYLTLKNATKHLTPYLDKVFLNDKKTWLEVESQRDYKVEQSQEWVSVIRLTTRTIEN